MSCVFDDPATRALKLALQRGQIRWLATSAMRAELVRVLAYPKMMQRLSLYQLRTASGFDARSMHRPISSLSAPKATLTCADPDDQKFIDLAVAHQATLISKDKAVLCMAKRLLVLDAQAQTAIDFVAI